MVALFAYSTSSGCTRRVGVSARLPDEGFDFAVVALAAVDDQATFPVIDHAEVLVPVDEGGSGLEATGHREGDLVRVAAFLYRAEPLAAALGIAAADLPEAIAVVRAKEGGVSLPPREPAGDRVSIAFDPLTMEAVELPAAAASPGPLELNIALTIAAQLALDVVPVLPTDAGPPGGCPTDCSELDTVCTVGVCASEGVCVSTARADGTPCDDGQFCTDPDFCQGGVCSGSPRDCSGGGDICNSGGCDETANMCTGLPLPDGGACSNGDFCVVGETCNSGTCGSGTPRDCSALADSCNSATCNEALDMCERAPLTDNTACDDGLFCTDPDTCTAGICSGPPRDCNTFALQCATGTCNEGTDLCVPTNVADGTACDDGDTCTTGDECTGGVCAGVAVEGSPGGPACSDGSDNDCDGDIDFRDSDCCDAGCTPACASGCCYEALSSGPSVSCENDCDCVFECAAAGSCPIGCSTTGTCVISCIGSDLCDVACLGSTCNVDCNNANTCQVNCVSGATCNVDCTNAVDCDQGNCSTGSTCLKDCTGAGTCDFQSCPGGAMACPGNIIVCNRPCP